MSRIPQDYPTVIPYLIVNDATAFIQFMIDVFDATLLNKHMRDEKLIMHAELKIGNSIIMLADSTNHFNLSNAGLFLYVENADVAYNKAKDKGASVITELSNQTYGRTGGVLDPFGNIWWITSVI